MGFLGVFIRNGELAEHLSSQSQGITAAFSRVNVHLEKKIMIISVIFRGAIYKIILALEVIVMHCMYTNTNQQG